MHNGLAINSTGENWHLLSTKYVAKYFGFVFLVFILKQNPYDFAVFINIRKPMDEAQCPYCLQMLLANVVSIHIGTELFQSKTPLFFSFGSSKSHIQFANMGRRGFQSSFVSAGAKPKRR